MKQVIFIFTVLISFVFWYNTRNINAQTEVRKGTWVYEKISADIHFTNSFKTQNTCDYEKTCSFYKKKKRKKGRAIEEMFSFIAFQPVFKRGFLFRAITLPDFTCDYSPLFFSVKKRGPPNA